MQTLVDRLKLANKWEQVGGAKTVAEIAQSVPNAAHVRSYALAVRRDSVRRQIIQEATETLRAAYDAPEEGDNESLLATAQERLFAIGEAAQQEGPSELSGELHKALEEIEARMGGGVPGLPTGFTDLDDKLGGLRPGELIILAARPSLGKTRARRFSRWARGDRGGH